MSKTVVSLLCALSLPAFAARTTGEGDPNLLVFQTDSARAIAGARQLFSNVCKELKNGCGSAKPLVVDRSAFVKAHPEAQLDARNAQVRRAPKNDRMIQGIQEQLEARAIDRALVMDCKPHGTNSLVNCGLYLYERDARAVVSSSVRSFTTPVREPSRWAPRLVRTFESGLVARERIKDDRLLSDFYARNALSEEKENATYAVGLDAGVTLVGSDALAQVPRASVSFGRVYGGHLLSGYGTYGKAARSTAIGRVGFTTMGAGLELDLRAEALESLTWELGLRTGWERSNLRIAEARSGFDTLNLGTRLGLLVSIGKIVKLGPGVAWSYRTTLSERGEGAGASGKLLRGAALEPGLRMEVSL